MTGVSAVPPTFPARRSPNRNLSSFRRRHNRVSATSFFSAGKDSLRQCSWPYWPSRPRAGRIITTAISTPARCHSTASPPPCYLLLHASRDARRWDLPAGEFLTIGTRRRAALPLGSSFWSFGDERKAHVISRKFDLGDARSAHLSEARPRPPGLRRDVSSVVDQFLLTGYPSTAVAPAGAGTLHPCVGEQGAGSAACARRCRTFATG